MIKLNGIELELDIFDADTADRYEKAVDLLPCEPAGTKMSDAIRSESKSAREFIETIFGEGVGVKVLPKDNLTTAYEVVETVIDEFIAQAEKASTMRQKLQKYSPNRAQRRG